MLRSLLTHLLLPCSPAALATALGWPAFGTPGRVALLGLIAASVVIGWWQLLRARRRSQAITMLTMQIEDLVDSDDPLDPQLTAGLAESIDGELQVLTEQLEAYVHAVADIATAEAGEAHAPADNDDRDDDGRDGEALLFEAYAPAAAPTTQSEIDELTRAAAETSRRAGEAAELARAARDAAAEGKMRLHAMVEALGEVERSGAETMRMIAVVRDVAFETNLLALNAGVEAARAGDAGRGFAVVAEELRSLSQRGTETAENLSQLLTTTGEQAQRGSQLAHDAEAALRTWTDTAERCREAVAGICSSQKRSKNQPAPLAEDLLAAGPQPGGQLGDTFFDILG